MQQAIERVECGNEEEKQKNSKSNPRYDDRNSDFFVEPLHPDQKTPRLLSLFPLEINFDAPPFVCSGTSFIHAMIVFARCDSCTP